MKNKRGPSGSRLTSAITLIIAILASVNHFLLEEPVTAADMTNYVL